MKIAGIEIVPAPESPPPFDVEARVFEDDTFLVLSASPEFKEPGEHAFHILTDACEQQPEPGGTIVVQPGQPLRLLAIVHDLGATRRGARTG